MLRYLGNRVVNEISKDTLQNLFAEDTAITLQVINAKLNILFDNFCIAPEGESADFYPQQNNAVADLSIDMTGQMVTEIWLQSQGVE